jgi:hypothetical protein
MHSCNLNSYIGHGLATKRINVMTVVFHNSNLITRNGSSNMMSTGVQHWSLLDRIRPIEPLTDHNLRTFLPVHSSTTLRETSHGSPPSLKATLLDSLSVNTLLFISKSSVNQWSSSILILCSLNDDSDIQWTTDELIFIYAKLTTEELLVIYNGPQKNCYLCIMKHRRTVIYVTWTQKTVIYM